MSMSFRKNFHYRALIAWLTMVVGGLATVLVVDYPTWEPANILGWTTATAVAAGVVVGAVQLRFSKDWLEGAWFLNGIAIVARVLQIFVYLFILGSIVGGLGYVVLLMPALAVLGIGQGDPARDRILGVAVAAWFVFLSGFGVLTAFYPMPGQGEGEINITYHCPHCHAKVERFQGRCHNCGGEFLS